MTDLNTERVAVGVEAGGRKEVIGKEKGKKEIGYKKSVGFKNVLVSLSGEGEKEEKERRREAKEWANWEGHKVFEWVKDAGQPAQKTRWILTKKGLPAGGGATPGEGGEDGHGFKLKARLCAQGTAHQDAQVGELISESYRFEGCD